MQQKRQYPDAFLHLLHQTENQLRNWDLKAAHTNCSIAMAMEMDAPQPHNLLGIYYELSGDDLVARKHYRAAYALDPTYKPACSNLERLAVFEWGPRNRNFDYGDEAAGKKARPAEER